MYEPLEKEVYLKLIHIEDSDSILKDDAIVKITIKANVLRVTVNYGVWEISAST